MCASTTQLAYKYVHYFLEIRLEAKNLTSANLAVVSGGKPTYFLSLSLLSQVELLLSTIVPPCLARAHMVGQRAI